MNKETFLNRYIEIETKTFIKKDKNNKLDELFNENEFNKSELTTTDILEIIDHLTTHNIKIRQPLYKYLIYPILSEQVEQNNVDAIKGLLRLDQNLIGYLGNTKDIKHSSFNLLEKGLNLSPNDRELLEYSERKTRNYLSNTLHELPTGVLFEENGASIEECEILIKEVEAYEILCNKLDRDERELIQECKYYYPAYRDYIKDYKNYKNFADYLDKECGALK